MIIGDDTNQDSEMITIHEWGNPFLTTPAATYESQLMGGSSCCSKTKNQGRLECSDDVRWKATPAININYIQLQYYFPHQRGRGASVIRTPEI
jgi:hypothetical protein